MLTRTARTSTLTQKKIAPPLDQAITVKKNSVGEKKGRRKPDLEGGTDFLQDKAHPLRRIDPKAFPLFPFNSINSPTHLKFISRTAA